jgi:uncharacterized protein
MRAAVFGVGAGLFFGFLLGWAQLTSPQTILDMLLLTDVYVFLLMGSAIATASVGIFCLRRAGATTLLGEPLAVEKTRIGRRHLWGSALFGAGWALSLACPAPVAAQLGGGDGAALFTATGLVAGIVVVGWWRRRAQAEGRASDAPAATGG